MESLILMSLFTNILLCFSSTHLVVEPKPISLSLLIC